MWVNVEDKWNHSCKNILENDKVDFQSYKFKSIPYTKPQFNCADLNWAVSSLSGLAENKLIWLRC